MNFKQTTKSLFIAGLSLVSLIHCGAQELTDGADTGENTPPEAVTDEVSGNSNTEIVIATADILANDVDPDGDELSLTSVDVLDIDLNGVEDHALELSDDGSQIILTPQTGYSGTIRLFYTVSDGTDESLGSINVTVTGVLYDCDGDTYGAADSSSDCAEAIESEEDCDDTDASVYPDRLDLPIGDGDLDCDGTDGMTDEEPVGTEDEVTVRKNTTKTIAVSTLLANDSDPEGEDLEITAVGNAQNGSVRLGALGNYVYFTPDTDFTGEASFEYTLSDGVNEVTVTVNVTVTPFTIMSSLSLNN